MTHPPAAVHQWRGTHLEQRYAGHRTESAGQLPVDDLVRTGHVVQS